MENPLVEITIGAGVELPALDPIFSILITPGWQHLNPAINKDFDEFYNSEGKRAGTYTSPDENSKIWTWNPPKD